MPNIPHEDEERIVLALMEQDGMASVMAIPGVWEAVSEHYNNDIIATWESEQDDADEEG